MIHQETYEPWIIDFGISKQRTLQEKSKLTNIGTVAFQAPETHQGLVSPSSDIFCLGVTLVALTNMIQDDDFEWHHVLDRCAYSSDFKNVVMKMIAVDYKQRFQTCQEVITALRQLQEKHPSVQN